MEKMGRKLFGKKLLQKKLTCDIPKLKHKKHAKQILPGKVLLRVPISGAARFTVMYSSSIWGHSFSDSHSISLYKFPAPWLWCVTVGEGPQSPDPNEAWLAPSNSSMSWRHKYVAVVNGWNAHGLYVCGSLWVKTIKTAYRRRKIKHESQKMLSDMLTVWGDVKFTASLQTTLRWAKPFPSAQCWAVHLAILSAFRKAWPHGQSTWTLVQWLIDY